MKRIKTYFLLVLSISILVACSGTSDEILDADLKSGQFGADKTNETKMVAKPFKAHFYTKRDYSNEDQGPIHCTEDPFLTFNYQVGEGEATHLGHFTTVMQFCGNGFYYNNLVGTLVASNGDELYIRFEEGVTGEVKLYGEEDRIPPYEAHFEDSFIFDGGTGRFENATGGGMTNSKVDLFDENGFILEHQTDHIWTGTLILPKK